MIIFPHAPQPVPMTNLQKMLYDKELIAVLAKQILANQCEAHIDMISDAGAEYKEFSEVENCIKGAKETVEDYIEDLLTDFRGELYDAVRAAEITVKKVVFSNEGLEDAEVEVK